MLNSMPVNTLGYALIIPFVVVIITLLIQLVIEIIKFLVKLFRGELSQIEYEEKNKNTPRYSNENGKDIGTEKESIEKLMGGYLSKHEDSDCDDSDYDEDYDYDYDDDDEDDDDEEDEKLIEKLVTRYFSGEEIIYITDDGYNMIHSKPHRYNELFTVQTKTNLYRVVVDGSYDNVIGVIKLK